LPDLSSSRTTGARDPVLVAAMARRKESIEVASAPLPDIQDDADLVITPAAVNNVNESLKQTVGSISSVQIKEPASDSPIKTPIES